MNRSILFLPVLVLTACSIAQPHPDVVDVAQAARLAGGVTVRTDQRWVLPPMSQVTLRSSDARHAQYAAAAQRGLARRFRVAPEAPWQLIVHWPAPEEAARESWVLQVDMIPWELMVPRPAERNRLVVDVLDASGTHWVQRVHVDVKPWWFGADWNDAQALERTFAEVGRALSGA